MTAASTFTWDGLNARDAGARLGLKYVWMGAEVESTQDLAHRFAEEGKPVARMLVW